MHRYACNHADPRRDELRFTKFHSRLNKVAFVLGVGGASPCHRQLVIDNGELGTEGGGGVIDKSAGEAKGVQRCGGDDSKAAAKLPGVFRDRVTEQPVVDDPDLTVVSKGLAASLDVLPDKGRAELHA